MPRNEIILNVFVASPSDVPEERKALESIVNELNKTWSKSLNVRLDLIKWETDVYPGFGEYAQDVINRQINDEYDVFVAIFWSKIGSPTEKSESGTLEEFDKAFKKHTDDPNAIDIMIYFKDQAIPPSKMDYVQLQKLQELKAKLDEKGGLYWSFDSTEDFEALLRSHLSKVAQKWSAKISHEVDTKSDQLSIDESSESKNIQEALDDEEDYGFLDYLEIYEDRMFDMTAALSSMTDATEKIGKQFTRRTEEINSLQSEHGQANIKQAKKIIKLSSVDLEKYSEVIESQIQITGKSREEAFEALSKALSLCVDFKEESKADDLSELEKSLESMKDAAQGMTGGLSGFRETLSNLPRLTMQLNKSKRRAVRALDQVLEEVETTAQSAQNVIEIIRELRTG